MKRGSALVLVIWTIAVLSILVLSFSYEAYRQSGINTYVQQRNRATHLIESGKIIAELILTTYKNVPDWDKDQDDAELFKDDAWYQEKQTLKGSSAVTIGPVYLDPEDKAGSLVTIVIEPINSGKQGLININELYHSTEAGSDGHVDERWWMIFRAFNIPEELSTPKEGTIKLWDILISSWNDWRDEDTNVSSVDGKECGAEDEWYEELEEEYKGIDDDTRSELKRRPRNGPIPDINELSYVRGFRDYPQILTGGVINPWEQRERDRITVKPGLIRLFSTDGSAKININNCDNPTALITVPGIFDLDTVARDGKDGDKVLEEAMEIAEAIIKAQKEEPEERDRMQGQGCWPYKDWDDMLQRVDNLSGSSVRSSDIGSEAKDYLIFGNSEDSVFKVRIIADAGTMERVVEAECYLKDDKVRYVRWNEAPSSGK